ncbi:MAG: hypothetical protein D6712_13235, partial [Chloroflexi bacterium]
SYFTNGLNFDFNVEIPDVASLTLTNSQLGLTGEVHFTTTVGIDFSPPPLAQLATLIAPPLSNYLRIQAPTNISDDDGQIGLFGTTDYDLDGDGDNVNDVQSFDISICCDGSNNNITQTISVTQAESTGWTLTDWVNAVQTKIDTAFAGTSIIQLDGTVVTYSAGDIVVTSEEVFDPVNNTGTGIYRLVFNSYVATPLSLNSGSDLLSGDLQFDLTVEENGGPTTTQTIVVTDTNQTDVNALASDIQAAVDAAFGAGLITVVVLGSAATNDLRIGFQRDENATSDWNAFSIEYNNVASDPMVADLGFSVDEDNVSISTRIAEFFLDNTVLRGYGTLALLDLDATASLGFLGISIVDGTGEVTMMASLSLQDPYTCTDATDPSTCSGPAPANPNRIYFDHLWDAVSGRVEESSPGVPVLAGDNSLLVYKRFLRPFISGFVDINLPIASNPAFPGLDGGPDTLTISITWQKPANPATDTPTNWVDAPPALFTTLNDHDCAGADLSAPDDGLFSGVCESGPGLDITINGSLKDLVDGFRDLDYNTILDGILMVADYLDNLGSPIADLLEAEIPIIDLSINDLLGYADKFHEFVNQVRSDPAGSLQLLEAKLEEALGLPVGSNLVNFAFDLGCDLGNDTPADTSDDCDLVGGPITAGNIVLRLDLNFDLTLSESYPFNLDLQDLADVLPSAM